MTTPTDHDLNVSLARLMGLDIPERLEWTIPDWQGSLDALFAPGGPVEYALAKGWRINICDYRDEWQAQIEGHPQGYKYGPALPEPAEALATALHEAFMKEQGQ